MGVNGCSEPSIKNLGVPLLAPKDVRRYKKMRSNRLPLWSIDWSLGRLENPINRGVAYSNYVECRSSYTIVYNINRVFVEAISLSRRTPTSLVLLGSICRSHRSEDSLVEATKKLKLGELIENTHTWRVSLNVLSLIRVNGFTICTSSYMKVFQICPLLRNTFSKHKISNNLYQSYTYNKSRNLLNEV